MIVVKEQTVSRWFQSMSLIIVNWVGDRWCSSDGTNISPVFLVDVHGGCGISSTLLLPSRQAAVPNSCVPKVAVSSPPTSPLAKSLDTVVRTLQLKWYTPNASTFSLGEAWLLCSSADTGAWLGITGMLLSLLEGSRLATVEDPVRSTGTSLNDSEVGTLDPGPTTDSTTFLLWLISKMRAFPSHLLVSSEIVRFLE